MRFWIYAIVALLALFAAYRSFGEYLPLPIPVVQKRRELETVRRKGLNLARLHNQYLLKSKDTDEMDDGGEGGSA